MSGMQQAADNYIFVIFLVNKIIGIILVPFIIILAFAAPLWMNNTTIFSLLVLGLFFLSRYFKTYGVLENKLPAGAITFCYIYNCFGNCTTCLLSIKLRLITSYKYEFCDW